MEPIGETVPPALAAQTALVEALRQPAVHGDGPAPARLVETHISFVLLTGRHAYKVKKAVDLGFFDGAHLATRRALCDEELRLNRRLAPDVYLDVVAVTGSAAAPVIGGPGVPIEYAVRMREFPQDALLSRMLARDALLPEHIDALAARVAAFHGMVEVAGVEGPYGRADEVRRLALDNCGALAPGDTEAARADLTALRDWIEREGAARRALLEARRRHGFVRECHGDLHLDNIALVDGRITIFDCIEFDDHLRWGDVMSEVAFTTMDLADRGRPDLGWRFLDAYLEETGDYAGLGVFRFFFVYRAMVRAKVTGLRAAQCAAGSERAAALAERHRYLALARQAIEPPRPAIVLMHGLAGSGKTTRAQRIVESVGAVRIRTDVERKRLLGFERRDHRAFGIEAGPYAPAATRRTYERVRGLAGDVAAAGFVVVVDGAFLARWQRDMFRTLAAEAGVPFAIATASEPLATLRARVVARAAAGTDASDADLGVLEHQVRTQEPLVSDEQPFVLAAGGEGQAAAGAVWLEELRRRLALPAR